LALAGIQPQILQPSEVGYGPYITLRISIFVRYYKPEHNASKAGSVPVLRGRISVQFGALQNASTQPRGPMIATELADAHASPDDGSLSRNWFWNMIR
jgi:hypothetical protein